MDKLLEKISNIKAEIENSTDIPVSLWFDSSDNAEIETMPDSEIISRLPAMIDHTLLRPDADSKEIERLCDDAKKYDFCSVCVYSQYVPFCRQLLGGSEVRICSVAGFPSGAMLSTVKAFEAEEAARLGADEVDMVINIAALKENNLQVAYDDIRSVVESVPENVIIKVIMENAYLSDDEKIKGCLISRAAGAKFVKTSTGFGPSGATIDDVKLMRAVVGPDTGVKAAGGIRDSSTAMAMVKAGANRLGASSSINIVTGLIRLSGPNCKGRGH